MDNIGTYEKLEFPKFRTPTIDTLNHGLKKHHIPFLLEVDVTKARSYIRNLKVRTGEGVSFSGWVMKCIGQAVSEHKHVHAIRKGKKTLIIFDDVDISIVVERKVNHSLNTSETLPMPCVIRKTNEKSVKDIHNEIRSAKTESLQEGKVQLGTRRDARLTKTFSSMPKFLRNLLVWRRLIKNPFFAKKTMGTVVLTSVGMFGGECSYGWVIPIGIHPLVIALGNITRKPGVIGNEIEIHEYLSMTILFDHDITDGAPVARFIQQFKEILENGYGLNE